jgi:hypothetical protein
MARVYHNHVCDEGLESSSMNISPTRGQTLHTRKELYSEDEPRAGGKPYEWQDLSRVRRWACLGWVHGYLFSPFLTIVSDLERAAAVG